MALGVSSVVLAATWSPGGLAAPDAAGAAPVVACPATDALITITADADLDPTCTYVAPFEITASDVVLDCKGAVIDGTGRGGVGILIHAPATVALSGVVVRNCDVGGFLNSVRVTRDGFRALAPGVEHADAFSDIVIEDSTFHDARGVGVFVDGYVTDVKIRRSTMRDAGSTGVYLEAGSARNVVQANVFDHNGYGENGLGGTVVSVGGVTARYWGTGREGLAIDGSRDNVVVGNTFTGNSAGGAFLYTNCGEYHLSRPNRWFERRYGATGNVIEANTFAGGVTGVWVGSRMGENTWPMECSDPAYIDDPGQLLRVSLDRASGNLVAANTFTGVTYGVRVEDDGTTVRQNTFVGDAPGQYAVVVGTRFRGAVLDQPVRGTSIEGNRATIAGNPSPFRWAWGAADTSFVGNTASGAQASFCEIVPLPTGPFVMVLAFALEPAGGPPATPPADLAYPIVGPQPACPVAAAPTPVVTPAFTG